MNETIHDLSFPMYVVKVQDFLQMEGVPKSHDEIREKLHPWQPGMFVIFISHQWLGTSHPDPLGQQMAVLRSALRGIVDGSLHVEADVISAVNNASNAVFGPKQRQGVAQGYVFLDWFAIPQVTARVKGVNEEHSRSKAALAVQSIPAYVEMSNLFVALVPEIVHSDTRQECNYTTWLSRGWCRAELWCHLLSNKQDTSVIVVHTATEAEFMFPLDWQENTIASGAFTVEADRSVVAQLGQVALDSKIEHLSNSVDLDLYRFYLACRPRMLGQEPIAWDLYNFLRCFRFGTFQQAVQDHHSMNGLLCALFAEDLQLLRLLLRFRAEVNSRLYGLQQLGYFDGQTLLMAAVKSKQSVPVVKMLLEHRADPNLNGVRGEGPCYLARTPLHVKMLIDARANIHANDGTYGLTPLSGAASHSETATVLALLDARCDPNPPLKGVGFSPLHGAVLFSRRNAHAQSSVELLLHRGADVNCQARPTGRYALLCHAARLHCSAVGFNKSGTMVRYLASMPGITPLGLSVLIGDASIMKLLLDSCAELHANDRGDTPEELAMMMGHKQLLPALQVFTT